MATARDHITADMAWLFAQDDEAVKDILLGPDHHRAVVQDLETMPGEFEGAARRRTAIHVQKSTLTPMPRPGQQITVDGETWDVESTDQSGPVDVLTLAQYR